jgi:hypothetical protein
VHNPVDARRRWFGVFFLIVAGGMLIWGQTVFKSRLEGIGFIIYWLVCFWFTGLAMVTALLDIRTLRRRTRDQHRDLFRHTLEEIEDEKKDERREPRQ